MAFFHLIFAAALSVALATVGVDVSQRTYGNSWSCVRDYGYEFAIIRVFMSTGSCDPNGPANINDAWNAGMNHVDGYIFPCYSCGNPAGQMDATINYLASHNVQVLKKGEVRAANSTLGVSVGMLWVDVEGTQYWSGNQGANADFIGAMIAQGQARGISIGIYTSASQWNPITGGTTRFSNLPLWYAHYDYVYNFSDFVPFGGWGRPAMKQYAGDESFCSAGWDKNCY